VANLMVVAMCARQQIRYKSMILLTKHK